MPLKHLQHFLIQTTDLEGTAKWYEDVLGLERGPHPDFKFPVVWLYLEGNDVLHLTEGGAGISENRKAYLGQQSEATTGSGVVDHVAFRCEGIADMLAHIKAMGIEHTTREVSAMDLFQVFVIDPNGVKVELNFENASREGVQAGLTTADLAN